jgi:hypothetical protein
VLIRLEGTGRARFRLQHARDCNGTPDDLSWTDVTMMSDRRIRPEQAISPRDGSVRGVMLDYVDGNTERTYRRHTAGWMRVVASDDQDDEERVRCATYIVTMGPLA